MTLHYIYHSCFAVEDSACLIIYDYWKDPEGELQQMLDAAEDKGQAVYFVISHFHQDHYNPSILEWCTQHPNWHLLPSYDTIRRRRIPKELPIAELRAGTVVNTPHFSIHCFHSTDVGVCTVTKLNDGTTFYHAGDNNNWYFPNNDLPSSALVRITPDQMEKLYLSTLREIKESFSTLHHAMIPVDHRLGQEMLRGPMQFMKTIPTQHIHPMHYCPVE
ncbi:MAG: MBL fold metallo-hydrolase [Bacteroidales bacterium]|nr:MBL fold metallo-hydrolase [Bacteroidales bacterium]